MWPSTGRNSADKPGKSMAITSGSSSKDGMPFGGLKSKGHGERKTSAGA